MRVEKQKSYANLFHSEHVAQMQILMKSLDHFRSKYGSAHENLYPQERSSPWRVAIFLVVYVHREK